MKGKTMTTSDFIQHLERHKRASGLTNARLARHAGVSADTIGRWLSHRATPSGALQARVRARLPQAFQAGVVPPVPVTQLVSPPASVPSGKRVVNLVAVVRDRSGSIRSYRLEEAIRASYNRTLQDLRDATARTGQETRLTLVDFGTAVHPVFAHLPIDRVLDDFLYLADMGSTALLDAAGDALKSLERQVASYDTAACDVSCLLVVLTDGEENVSRSFNASSLRELCRRLQATDRFTVTFQVPRGHKGALCANFLVPEGNVFEWEQTAKGAERATQARSAGIDSYYTSRSLGETKSVSFYSDLSGVTKADLSRLDDLTAQVRVFEVKKAGQIRKVVEAQTGGTMLKGGAFYQVFKAEKKVQSYKKIVIRDKATKRIYGGDQARVLLGLPAGQDVRLVPGNHAGFDLFVQSTSVNRSVPKGTFVIYAPQFGVAFTEGPSAPSRASAP